MLTLKKLNKAIDDITALVSIKFKDKKDLSKQPYLYHIFTVAQKAANIAKSLEESQIIIRTCYLVGLCHDLLEDTDMTENELTDIIQDVNIINSIKLCTHNPLDSYKNYILKIYNADSDIAKYVKIADLEHNMDIRRLKKLEISECRRLRKYFYSWQLLNNIITSEEYELIQ